MRRVALLSALLGLGCHPQINERRAGSGANVEGGGERAAEVERAPEGRATGAARAPGEGEGAASPELRAAFAQLLQTERGALAGAEAEKYPSLAASLAYYEHRGDALAWCSGPEPTRRAEAIVAAIEGLAADGLLPADYLAEVRASLASATPPHHAELARLELELTRALLGAAAHLLHGRVDPLRIHAEWSAPGRSADIFAQIDAAAAGGELGSLLHTWRPDAPEYGRLLGALADYRRIEESGGWRRIPGPAPIEPGAKGSAKGALRQQELLRARLEATGELVAGADVDAGSLRAAVAAFQGRHGHDPTGTVDARTLESLNVPVSRRVEQLRANLERWRWLPTDLGERHVRVNIAGFDVRLFEGGRSVVEMRAVVGKTYRKTPSTAAP